VGKTNFRSELKKRTFDERYRRI